jgi:probable addiction module antidote protein
MGLHTEPFDVADYLTDEETISAYLTEAPESDDPRLIAQVLGDIARARGGMTELSRQTGLSREALYRALSENGNPEFFTILKVVRAFGIKLSATAVKTDAVAA